MAGTPRANWSVSLMTATSARSSSRCSWTNCSRLSEPISSSPSISIVTLTGSPPCCLPGGHRLDVRPDLPLVVHRAAGIDGIVPVSSLRTVGSNGGVVHWSSGSGGCTS